MRGKSAKKSGSVFKKLLSFRPPAWAGLVVILAMVAGAEAWLANSGKVKFGELLKGEGGKVLGEATRMEAEEKKIRTEIEFWEEVLEAQPTYFDGLVRLSVYHWQLREDEKSREYLSRAAEVDPGNEVLEEIEEMVEL